MKTNKCRALFMCIFQKAEQEYRYLLKKQTKMYKNIKKITMLLIVGTTVLTTACKKEEPVTPATSSQAEQPAAPYQAKESDIIGTWSVPSTSPYLGGKKLEYKTDHTMNLISDYSTRTHQVWTLTGNTLESTFTTTNMHDKEWWEKIILTVKGYEEVVNTQYNYTDRYLTVEGVMTSNYDGVATNTDRIDTLGVISGRLSQRVRQ